MTGPQVCVSVDIADYELRTGQNVPDDQEPTIQRLLDDTALLVCLYLGECADEVAASYADVLIAMVCSHVYVASSAPSPWVQSESVGTTNVTYNTDAGAYPVFGLTAEEQRVLDQLVLVACPASAPRGIGSVGQIGATWGGPSPSSWAADVDVWVTS